MSEPQTLSYEAPRTTISGIGIGIGTIALQLIGIYCFVLALPLIAVLASIAGAAGGGRGIGRTWQFLISFITPAFYIASGVLLMRFAPRLSMWLFRDAVNGVMAGPVTAPTGQYLQAIAFSVAGVLTMIHAAPRLVAMAWLGAVGNPFGGGYAEMIEPVVQLLAGLTLFLQSKGLSRLWHRLRTGGVVGTASVHSGADKA